MLRPLVLHTLPQLFAHCLHPNHEWAALYRHSMNLADYNGVDTHELPLTTPFIADPDFTIRYAYVNPDYREWAEPAEILRALGSR